MLNIIKIRKSGDYEITVDLFKNNKYPIHTMIAKVGKYKYHECNICLYNTKPGPFCRGVCKTLENSKIVSEFIKEEFGINIFGLSLTPINDEIHKLPSLD